MKIGDLVSCYPHGNPDISEETFGLVVGFNKKSEGGQDFVHVFCGGQTLVFFCFDIILKKAL